MTNNLREKTEEKYILAIETAFTGSLSILSNRRVVDGWRGSLKISRAEDVLEQINNLLSRNSIEKQNIERIIVSRGEGSSTGEKIGLAIAKGLGKALGCSVIQTSLFEALLKEIPGELKGRYLAAVITEKNVQYREFNLPDDCTKDISVKAALGTLSREVFFGKYIDEYVNKNIVIATLVSPDEFQTSDAVIMISKSPAEIIGTNYCV